MSIEKLIKELLVEAIVEAYQRIQNADAVDAKEEAPARRTRRTKAEIEAEKKQIPTTGEVEGTLKDLYPAEKVKSVQQVTPKKDFSYDMLQRIVLDYVMENGRVEAEKLLAPFGVKKATELQDHQWEAVYKVFADAASGEDIA